MIMQLSKFTDYSFRALVYLAQNQDRLCTVEELAKNLHTSEHHMKKVVHKLATGGYITSLKGRAGGLHLGMEPKNINLGEILKFTENNLNIFSCYLETDTCPLRSCGCKLKQVSHIALGHFIHEFEKYTLEDVL